MTEPVSSIALSATHFSQNETIVFPNVMSTGNVYTFSLENGSNVLQLAPEGIYLPTIELVDLAGNSNTYTLDAADAETVLRPIELDSTDPVISNFQIGSSNTSGNIDQCGTESSGAKIIASNGDTVTVSFVATDIGSSGITELPTVLLGSNPLSCAQDGNNYSCSATIEEAVFADGSSSFQVVVVDNAGNSASASYGTVLSTTSPTWWCRCLAESAPAGGSFIIR